MTANEPPKPLSYGESVLGQLIRNAKASYDVPGNESGAWQKLLVHRQATAERRWRTMTRLAVPAAALAGLFIYVKIRTLPAPLTLNADPNVVTVAHPVVSASVTRIDPTLVPLPAFSSTPPDATTLPTLPRAVDCSRVKRSSSPKDWAICLERRSQGNSLDAERALFELSQFRQRTQHDAHGALAALKSYRQRFPNGALRGEVDFALVELLQQLGRANEALLESERLLTTAWGRSRSSELRLLRGRVAQDQLSDCPQAIRELSLVRNEFGNVGNEATLRSAECFERTGDTASAKSAYADYLSRSGITRAAYVRKRLEGLEPIP